LPIGDKHLQQTLLLFVARYGLFVLKLPLSPQSANQPYGKFDGNLFCSCILLVLLAVVLLGTLLDVRHERATSMKWDLLYHVSTNVRHLVGQRDGRMTWTTVDESPAGSDPVTADSQISDEQTPSGNAESEGLQQPPNTCLLVEAFNYKPGMIVV